MYDSTIDFTLDTICPWTYLAKKRLDEALRLVRATDASSKVTFTIKYRPYQLYPGASQTGEDKYEWYKKTRYGNSAEKMDMYVKLMTAYGHSAGIDFKFAGTVANTLQAHRLIQHYQNTSPNGAVIADKLVSSLYHLYFEEEMHPSSHETLLAACKAAGVDEAEAKAFIENEDEGLPELKAQIGEEAGNVSDQVPVVRIEGRKRDVTILGANEVDDYVKALTQIVKESE